jgi:hypothetical protein
MNWIGVEEQECVRGSKYSKLLRDLLIQVKSKQSKCQCDCEVEEGECDVNQNLG